MLFYCQLLKTHFSDSSGTECSSLDVSTCKSNQPLGKTGTLLPLPSIEDLNDYYFEIPDKGDIQVLGILENMGKGQRKCY